MLVALIGDGFGTSHLKVVIVDILLVNLLNGMSLGMVLFLLASGFSLVYGVMGILNLAHGALYMIGAYVAWSIAIQSGLNFGIAILAGSLAAGVVGLLVERGFLSHLYKQFNEQALITFGFFYVLTNLSLLIWGPVVRAPFTASMLSGFSFSIGELVYPMSRVTIILIGLVVAIGVWLLVNKTRVGSIIRAGMDDKEMAIALGINFETVSIAVFVLAASLAGFAGAVGAQLLGAHTQLSLSTLLLALVVVVVGGVGSIEGALLGGVIIGLIDSFGKALFPEFAMFTMWVTMIVILLVRPSGLLGRKV